MACECLNIAVLIMIDDCTIIRHFLKCAGAVGSANHALIIGSHDKTIALDLYIG